MLQSMLNECLQWEAVLVKAKEQCYRACYEARAVQAREHCYRACYEDRAVQAREQCIFATHVELHIPD